MSGRKTSRAAFSQKVLEAMVNFPQNAHFYSPESKIPQKVHNPAQDFADFSQNFVGNRAENVRTIIDGHLVDISWRRTLEYIKSLDETTN